MATPDPMVTVGVMCEGFPVEMIVRGYLCGSAWRTYKSGVREILRREVAGRNARKPEIPGTHRYSDYES